MKAHERTAARAVADASATLAGRIAAAVPEAKVETLTGGGVRLSGRRLARRVLASAALRWPAELLR